MSREIVFYMTSGQRHYVRDLDNGGRARLVSALGEQETRFVYVEVDEGGVRHSRMLQVDRIESVDL